MKKESLIQYGLSNTSIEKELRLEQFRVAIFGSARIKPNDKFYTEVMELAKEIGKMEIDVITGGGPGIMDAASLGHQMGTNGTSQSIGFTIELPWENRGNDHLNLEKRFARFSDRLDHFMAVSDIAIIMPGGIGTCLELFYAWQLTQVKHTQKIPIIFHGKMWHELKKWIEKYLLKDELISPEDMENIFCVNTNKEAMQIVKKEYKKYKAKTKKERLAKRQYKTKMGMI